MASELTLGFTVAYSDANGETDSITLSAYVLSAATAGIKSHVTQSIPITVETVLNLGPAASPALLAIKNLDKTNFVTVKNQASGKVLAKIKPGGGVLIPCGADLTVPVATADTAACVLDIFAC